MSYYRLITLKLSELETIGASQDIAGYIDNALDFQKHRPSKNNDIITVPSGEYNRDHREIGAVHGYASSYNETKFQIQISPDNQDIALLAVDMASFSLRIGNQKYGQKIKELLESLYPKASKQSEDSLANVWDLHTTGQNESDSVPSLNLLGFLKPGETYEITMNGRCFDWGDAFETGQHQVTRLPNDGEQIPLLGEKRQPITEQLALKL